MPKPTDELKMKSVESRLVPKLFKRKRLHLEKPTDKIDSVKIVKQNSEGVNVAAVLRYADCEKPVPVNVWIPLPNTNRLYQRLQRQHPEWSTKKCKVATKTFLSQHVMKQLKHFWRKHRPAEESLVLDEELNMESP